ncbi:MAG: hypothetical protein ACE5HS_06650 [bacterium]
MKNPILTFGLLLSALIISQSAWTDDGQSFFENIDYDWMKNPYWFDGKAEINFYDATIMRYGQPRETQEIYQIVVAERHRTDQKVKADDWRAPDAMPVLKFNFVLNFQTGIYTYHQMASIFFKQEDAHVYKMTLTSNEWCGNTFKEIVHFEDTHVLNYNSYFDGTGSGSYPLPDEKDLVLYDGLPVQLRALKFQTGKSLDLKLLSKQITNNARKPELSLAKIEIGEKETLKTPMGDIQTYALVVKHGQGQDKFWIEAKFPNRVIKWRTFDGSEFTLRQTKKLEYWKLNKAGGEKYLE